LSLSLGNVNRVGLQPSFFVTHGEPLLRVFLVSQATYGILMAYWWQMHYYEEQDNKNGAVLRWSRANPIEEIATLKRQLSEELQAQIAGHMMQSGDAPSVDRGVSEAPARKRRLWFGLG
jgi:hypothetical protein